MWFFRKSVSRELEAKKFEILESTFSGGRTDISQLKKSVCKERVFLQQHLESFVPFHPESWTVTQNGVVGPQSILLRARSVEPSKHLLIFHGV